MIVEHDPMLYEDSGHKAKYEILGPDADLQGGDHLALPPKLDLRLQR
jgi:hypothetical protein